MKSENFYEKIIIILKNDWKLITILTAIFAFYFYYTSTFDYFKKKGIPYLKPVIVLGSLGPRIMAKKAFHDFQLEIYDKFKGQRLGGIFEGRRPVLYILDPELIKAVTIRDFDHFVDRNTINARNPAYFAFSLLNLKGQHWKGVRSLITPVFSSSRLRNMLPLLELCSNQMVEYLKHHDQEDMEMKATMGHFTLEVIGACAFGIKSDALTDENSHFIKVAQNFDSLSKTKRFLLLLLLVFMPKALRVLNVSFFNPEATGELMRILKVAKEERKVDKSSANKNDFLQLLLDVASKEESDPENKDKLMTDDTIDAQCFLFLLAGYETSSTLLSFAIHELATKPELQEKLRSHILETTEGKEMSYELLNELGYLEAFLLETLRMYPPVARIDRAVTKPYTLPGTKVHLKPGDAVVIPGYGIHMDPQYYPEPHEFRPERFLGDEKKNRPSHLFLAFGAGPRNCIGLRFAMISAKIGMVALMKNFRFKRCDKTEEPIQFNKRSVLLKATSGLWVRVEAL